MHRSIATLIVLTACGAATTSRPPVVAPDASRAGACDATRARWELARNAKTTASFRSATGAPCHCGNGKVDVCSARVDCSGGPGFPCDSVPMTSFQEPCDGKDLGGMTCERLGFRGGALACTAACALDTSGCDWLPKGAKAAALPPSDALDAMVANDDEILVLATPLGKAAPVIARRFDRELRVVGETTIPGAFAGVAATAHGFFVATRDDAKSPPASAVYDVASASPLFSFADRVASLWTVRGADRALRDPVALLTSASGPEQLLRVRRGERPVATDARSTAEWDGEAVETPSGIVLPAGRFEALFRVRADGSSERLPLPEECPVRARYAPGWLSWVDGAMRATIEPVDDSLHARGAPSSFDARLDAPVFLGDWLWLGDDDFARRDADAKVVQLARGPVAPIMAAPFAGGLAVVWNRGPKPLTIVPLAR